MFCTAGAAATMTLPAATAGTIVIFSIKRHYRWNSYISFDAAGSDVWATGSVIESRGSSEVTFDTAAAVKLN